MWRNQSTKQWELCSKWWKLLPADLQEIPCPKSNEVKKKSKDQKKARIVFLRRREEQGCPTKRTLSIKMCHKKGNKYIYIYINKNRVFPSNETWCVYNNIPCYEKIFYVNMIKYICTYISYEKVVALLLFCMPLQGFL